MNKEKTMENFDKILDECIDRVNSGESLQSCLTSYPACAEQLKPLLSAAAKSKSAFAFTPQPHAKTAARGRFDAARVGSRGNTQYTGGWLSRVVGKPLIFAGVAVAAVVVAVLYFGSNQPYYPIIPGPEPHAEGNFVLLISDDINAIADFASVDVTISAVQLFASGEGKWLEIEPEIKQVDLASVQGDDSIQIWRGDLPEDEYTKIVIDVESVRGVLKATGESVDIKLPSSKLQLHLPFRVSAGTVTSFTYDITVFSTGSGHGNSKYILKPQAGESGAVVAGRKQD
ncbi:MAG: DUF4382 domain-containing protein [Dehalococcoidaceae bacterium]|nr:DUF4382 domain-containing protein [Dehalococcoidaceae bacterium]